MWRMGGARKEAKSIGIVMAILLAGAITIALLLRDASESGREDEGFLELLHSLGYVDHVSGDPDPERAGVVLHDPSRASKGINAYCSVRSTNVRFLDMNGTVLHTISLPEVGVGRDCLLMPTGDGDFLVLVSPILVRIGWDSQVRWISREGHHHDLAVDGTGRIYTLAERPGLLQRSDDQIPIRDHSILILDGDGEVVREIELSPLFGPGIPAERIAWMR